MNWYRVVWEIDVEAENPLDAARQARTIQLDPNNIADHFQVHEELIDDLKEPEPIATFDVNVLSEEVEQF